jgi:hypothetical protein
VDNRFNDLKKERCIEMYRALTNKDEMSHSCKDLLAMMKHHESLDMEKESSEYVRQGRPSSFGVSQAKLQRRFTGNLSGASLATWSTSA